jgi:hypothetical protein
MRYSVLEGANGTQAGIKGIWASVKLSSQTHASFDGQKSFAAGKASDEVQCKLYVNEGPWPEVWTQPSYRWISPQSDPGYDNAIQVTLDINHNSDMNTS